MLPPLPGGCALAAITTAPASIISVNYFFDDNHTCVLLNISALLVQLRIQAFDEFKRPECTRFHLRELQFQTFSRGNMPPDPLECHALGSPDGGYRAHIDTILYLSAPSITKTLCKKKQRTKKRQLRSKHNSELKQQELRQNLPGENLSWNSWK